MAGRGKRLWPLTEKTPKNLIPVKGKPLLEYALEEARQSGLRQVVLIVSPENKSAFHSYIRKNKKRFPWFVFQVRVQERPAGNGHALLPAADIIKNGPFMVRFCDDILLHTAPITGSLLKIFDFYQASVVLLERVSWDFVSRFGVVGTKKPKNKDKFREADGNIYEITEIIEKPARERAPSNLTVVGGYVLTPTVFRNLQKVADSLPQAADDAIPINVGLQIELITGNKVYGWEFPGKRLDCGTLENLKRTEDFLKSIRDCQV